MIQDIRYSIRSLLKRPAFTAVVLLTLALGIGVNTAIFSAVNDLVLRPVAAAEPERLAHVFFGPTQESRVYDDISWPNYVDLRDRNRTFEGLLGFQFTGVALSENGGRAEEERADVIYGEFVTGNYFEVLGISPERGRGFLPEESSVPNKYPVVVLSHNLWQRRLNSDPAFVGKTIFLNGQPFTVIGIAPAAFKGLKFPLASDFWTPVMMRTQLLRSDEWINGRDYNFLQVVGRLKPGVDVKQAEADLNIIGRNLEQTYPTANQGTKLQVVPESEGRLSDAFKVITFSSMLALVVVGLVLIVACANVANLQLARGSERAKEIGVRVAVGASRIRIVRQLLTESLVLSLAGGLLGLVLAYWCSGLMGASIPPFAYQLDLTFALDSRALVWAFLISLLTGIVSGLVPALHAARADLVSVLKSDSSAAATGPTRKRRLPNLRNSLVIAQVAISMIVLVCAGLFLRSLRRVQAIDPGFKTNNLISVSVSPGLLGYNVEECKRFYSELRRRVEALPGARAASFVNNLQLGDSSNSTGPLIVEGQPAPAPNQGMIIGYFSVGPKYFETAGTEITKGREFTEQDDDKGPKVVIINQELARRLFGSDELALGKRFRLGDLSSPLLEIVGIARDGKYRNIYEDPRPYMYLPHQQRQQLATVATSFLLVRARSAGDLKAVVEGMRTEVRRLDARVPITDMRIGDQLLSWAYWGPQLGAGMAAGFGILVLLLATTGLYSIMSYTVMRRRHEIGIRMALGAQREDVLRLMINRGMTMALIGLMVGVAVALALSRVVANLLLDVSATDPLTFVAVSLLLASVALLACYIPARRATKVDPLVALRYE
jgi:putative ABC transport system permease protein